MDKWCVRGGWPGISHYEAEWVVLGRGKEEILGGFWVWAWDLQRREFGHLGAGVWRRLECARTAPQQVFGMGGKS